MTFEKYKLKRALAKKITTVSLIVISYSEFSTKLTGNNLAASEWQFQQQVPVTDIDAHIWRFEIVVEHQSCKTNGGKQPKKWGKRGEKRSAKCIRLD